MSYLITRDIGIDAGHRVALHGSKCRNLHGHRYHIEVTLLGDLEERGEETGMVLDFTFLKILMIEHIQEPCDHVCILDIKDPLLVHQLGPSYVIVQKRVSDQGYGAFTSGVWDWGALYVVPFTPTAENLARHWYERLVGPVANRSGGRAAMHHVKVWETPNCTASYGSRLV